MDSMQWRDSNKNHKQKRSETMKQNDQKVNKSNGEKTSSRNGWHSLYIGSVAPFNHGPVGSGFGLVSPEGEVMGRVGIFPSYKTIIEAECEALDFGLGVAEGMVGRLRIFSDSEVVIRQLTGAGQVEADHLQLLQDRAINQLKKFDCYELCHITREENQEAVRVVKQAIEQAIDREIQKLPDWAKLAIDRVGEIGAQG
jgi:ribonuclease HI